MKEKFSHELMSSVDVVSQYIPVTILTDDDV